MMFANLDKVVEGDRFVIENMGEAFVYQVVSTEVIEPHNTVGLRVTPSYMEQ